MALGELGQQLIYQEFWPHWCCSSPLVALHRPQVKYPHTSHSPRYKWNSASERNSTVIGTRGFLSPFIFGRWVGMIEIGADPEI